MGLAFMKKDIDVNDCEFPPNTPQKLRHALNFQNGRNKLPEQPASIHFFNERRKRGEKEGIFLLILVRKI